MSNNIKYARAYAEILHDINFNEHTPEEYRRIHKELKQYGDGIRFLARYPMFPYYSSIVCSMLALVLALLMFI